MRPSPERPIASQLSVCAAPYTGIIIAAVIMMFLYSFVYFQRKSHLMAILRIPITLIIASAPIVAVLGYSCAVALAVLIIEFILLVAYFLAPIQKKDGTRKPKRLDSSKRLHRR